jgi:hypothetical protein
VVTRADRMGDDAILPDAGARIGLPPLLPHGSRPACCLSLPLRLVDPDLGSAEAAVLAGGGGHDWLELPCLLCYAPW